MVTFRNDSFPSPMGLIKLVQSRPNDWKIRPDHKVVVKGEWDRPDARLNAAERILTALVKAAQTA